MTLQASGVISLDNLQAEYGGPTPIALLNYHRGGSYVPNTTENSNVPTSGILALFDFYNGSSVISSSISGGGTVSNSTGSASFSLSDSSNFISPTYAWSTTAGSLSSTTVQSPTLTLTAAASTNVSATVTCTVSSSGKSSTHSVTCTYDNTASNETVSISGGGSYSGSTQGHTFTLTASGTPTTPSAYSWSTTAGTLSSTTAASVDLTVSTTTTVTATVTCVMTVSGKNYTAQTSCSYTYVPACFSGCMRILTSKGYVRFDELPPVFTVVNHTGKHLAKLLVHENSTEPMRRMGRHLVTERHLIKVGDQWIPARELFHERMPIEPRTVYNAHVMTDNPDDHHYLLENGLTAHNIKS